MPDSVGIVLINFNNLSDTYECLKTIEGSKANPIVVVVDNNSKIKPDQQKLSSIHENTHLILNNENEGFARGNNIGFDYLQKKYVIDYIIFLNNDTLLAENTLSILYETISKKRVDALTCKIVDSDNKIWYAGGDIDYLRGWPKLKDLKKDNDQLKESQSREVTFISGCLFMIKADLYKEVGGFDDRFFMYVEDLDLSFRMVKKGLKLFYTDETFIIHKVNGSFGSDVNTKKGMHPENPNLAFHFYHKMSNRFIMMK